MNRSMIRIWFVMVAVIVCGAILVSGCGTKIAIPEATGLFSVSAYSLYDEFSDSDVRELAISQGAIFVLKDDGLYKRDLEYGLLNSVDTGLWLQYYSRSLCIDDEGLRVFVYNGFEKKVTWYSTNDLAFLGSTDLPDFQYVNGMATSSLGIEQVPGSSTYVYFSDNMAGVIHRYAFDEFNGLTPHGILARADGASARFVHKPFGLARDFENHILACDPDTNRNWVIRFDSTPDLDDTSLNSLEPDPLRGFAAMFTDPVCAIAAPMEFVLGDAASCNQTDWVGGPSSVEGEFFSPTYVTVDGSGRIFVSDTRNNRIQVFTQQGDFDLLFGNEETTFLPGSLGVVDVRHSGEEDGVNYGAFVYIVLPHLHKVQCFISSEHFIKLNGTPPPEE